MSEAAPAPVVAAPAAPAAPVVAAPAPTFDTAGHFRQHAGGALHRAPTLADIGITDVNSPMTAQQQIAWQQRQSLHGERQKWLSEATSAIDGPYKAGDIELPPMSYDMRRKAADAAASRPGVPISAIIAEIRQQELVAAALERHQRSTQKSQEDALAARKMDIPNPDPSRKPPEGVDPKKFDAKAEFGKKLADGHKMSVADHMKGEGIDLDKLVREMEEGTESNPRAR